MTTEIEGPKASTQKPLSTTFGRYRLIAELGVGGMASVYLAVMRGRNGFNKLVVLKVPREVIAEDANMLAMFLDEARLAARLSHPNVVQTYEVIEEAGRDILVMEYLDGQTLNGVLARLRHVKKRMPIAMQLRIISEVLTGLHYTHELADYDGTPLQLVHRDASPHNIFVTFDGSIKVLDFGIAKATTSLHETQIGTFKGKVRFMPPEQLLGLPVDRRADIFAVGTMLWEAATGDGMWKTKSDVQVISAVTGRQIPAPRDIDPSVDARLDAICRKALAHDPDERYATALELQADIEAYLKDLPEEFTTRDVGAFVSELFSELRVKRKGIIEAQIKKANEAPADEYTALAPRDLTGSSPALPLIGSGPTLSTDVVDLSRSASISNGSGVVSTTGQATSTTLPAERRRSSRSVLVFVGLAAIAIGIGGTLVAMRSRAQAPAPASTQLASAAPPPIVTGAPPPSAPVGAASDETTTVSIAARPAEAKLFVDDVPVPTNPFVHKGPKDGTSHNVRAEARGYATRSMVVTYDAEKEIVLALDRVGAPPTPPVIVTVTRPAPPAAPPLHVAAVTAPASTPAAAPAPATADTKPGAAPAKKPPRAIDSTNLWER